MNSKPFLVCLTAILLAGTTFTACSKSENNSSIPSKEANSSSEIILEAPETSPVAANGDMNAETIVDFEPSVAAQSGQAFLAICEEQNWIQYMGVNDDIEHTMLTYNAGVADIKGNGSYTVSVTTDTKGFRYDTTGKADDDSITPQGLQFAAVMIKDGNTLFPDAVITIDSISVDGAEIPLTAKSYTNSDDDIELRSNIYNTWVESLPEDARSEEGLLADSENASEYAPVIINPADFRTWKTVEVKFTVSGISDANNTLSEDGDNILPEDNLNELGEEEKNEEDNQ